MRACGVEQSNPAIVSRTVSFRPKKDVFHQHLLISLRYKKDRKSESPPPIAIRLSRRPAQDASPESDIVFG
jgi:hypothetical protein